MFKEKAKKSVLLNHDNRFIDKMLKQRIKCNYQVKSNDNSDCSSSSEDEEQKAAKIISILKKKPE